MGDPIQSELAPSECLALLASVPVGRVGLSIDALPVVIPVSFALADRHVVFRAAAGRKFQAATTGAVVAFEADWYEPCGSSGWSVLVQGTTVLVSDPADIAHLSALTVDPWAGDANTGPLVRISTPKITGRRFVRGFTP